MEITEEKKTIELLNKVFVGRDEEMAVLHESYDAVLGDVSQVVYIKGNPGTGKTFLVEHFMNELISQKGVYVKGKFRQNDQTSLNVLSDIIEQVIKHILTLPKDYKEEIIDKLEKELGSGIYSIYSVCPFLDKLVEINKNKSKMKSVHEHYQIVQSASLFLQVIADSIFPMVVFIDDIQWADALTIEVMENFGNQLMNSTAFIVLSSRELEAEDTRLQNDYLDKILQKDNIRKIKLEKINESSLKKLLHLVFATGIDRIDYVTRIIYGLSLGNPLYIKEIIGSYIEQGVLYYDYENSKWQVVFHKLNEIDLYQDIQKIITHRILKLTHIDIQVLEIMACIAHSVSVNQLSKMLRLPKEIIVKSLSDLEEHLIIVGIHADYDDNTVYDFVHDLFTENVYMRMSDERKESLHFIIAEYYINNEINLVEYGSISKHIMKSNIINHTPSNLEKWVDVLFEAGQEFKKKMIYDQSIDVLLKGISLTDHLDDSNKRIHDINLRLELGFCEYISGNTKVAANIFKNLLLNYKDSQTRLDVARKELSIYAFLGNFPEVLKKSDEIFNLCNYKIRKNISIPNILMKRLTLSNKKIEALIQTNTIIDHKSEIILDTLVTMLPATEKEDETFFVNALIQIGNLSIKKGKSEFAPLGYIAYSYLYHYIFKDHKKAKMFQQLAEEMIKDVDNVEAKSISLGMIGVLLSHRTDTIDQSIQYMMQALKENHRSGYTFLSEYLSIMVVFAMYTQGRALAEIEKHMTENVFKTLKAENNTTNFIIEMFSHHFHILKYGQPKDGYNRFCIEAENYNDSKKLAFFSYKLQEYYLLEKNDQAFEVIAQFGDDPLPIKGHIAFADNLFFIILVRCEKHNTMSKTEQKKNLKLINKMLNALDEVIKASKEDHYARYLMAKSVFEHIVNSDALYEKNINQAIQIAEEKANYNVLGIGNLLLSKHYADNYKLNQYYMLNAIEAFDAWGADYICDYYRKKTDTSHTMKKIDMEKNRQLDGEKVIAETIKEMDVLDESQSLQILMVNIHKISRCNYCAVIEEKNDEMYIFMEKNDDGDVKVYKDFKNINQSQYLSRKIIRYVGRTNEEVLLTEQQISGPFQNDLYIKSLEEVAIICVPVIFNGVQTGMIYVEGVNDFASTRDLIKGTLPSIVIKKQFDNTKENVLQINQVLSNREIEVLELVAKGLSNAAISKSLFISLGTVKNHLSNIYLKLEVDSRIMAVVKAKDLNIIQL